MAEHRRDERHVARALGRLAQRSDHVLRLAAFEHDLPLELEEERIMGTGREQRIGFVLCFFRVAAQVISISPRIMGGDALVGLRIFDHGVTGIGEAVELGLDPLNRASSAGSIGLL